MAVNIILLAAGKGQRFQASSPTKLGCDTIKQLAKLDGKPLVNHSIENLIPLLKQREVNTLYVTLGANKNAIKAVLPQCISVISSQQWPQGMGHTLAESVQSVKAQSSHVLIALADQVLISTEHYHTLLTTSNKHPNKIIATLCDDKLMAPAIFPEKYFPQLVKLQGDKGAGIILQHHANKADAIPCTNAKFDVDTLTNLEQVSQMLKQQPLKETVLSH